MWPSPGILNPAVLISSNSRMLLSQSSQIPCATTSYHMTLYYIIDTYGSVLCNKIDILICMVKL